MVFSQAQEQKKFATKYRQVKYWMLQRSALLSKFCGCSPHTYKYINLLQKIALHILMPQGHTGPTLYITQTTKIPPINSSLYSCN